MIANEVNCVTAITHRHEVKNGNILQGKVLQCCYCDEFKMCVLNPKVTAKIKSQRIIANELTKEIKWKHCF
jgi:hypothetical protein